ncbi:unnamed protein product [Lampetra fluviatilis]
MFVPQHEGGIPQSRTVGCRAEGRMERGQTPAVALAEVGEVGFGMEIGKRDWLIVSLIVSLSLSLSLAPCSLQPRLDSESLFVPEQEDYDTRCVVPRRPKSPRSSMQALEPRLAHSGAGSPCRRGFVVDGVVAGALKCKRAAEMMESRRRVRAPLAGVHVGMPGAEVEALPSGRAHTIGYGPGPLCECANLYATPLPPFTKPHCPQPAPALLLCKACGGDSSQEAARSQSAMTGPAQQNEPPAT